ncbi:hypothetical protein PVAP13_7KG105263 [Panicum virgatum]|uniref:Uncharacterized protein n=1 Tax=Panicum virgatum TaxID=38727 RepID=A0A8T0Q8V4_PANVG|nr:hypothetical protein PVAP13_7KG105263 [Panicum virgatum]
MRAPHGRPWFDSIYSLFSLFSPPSPFSFSSKIKCRRPAIPSSSPDAPAPPPPRHGPAAISPLPHRPSSSAVRGGGRAFAASVRDGRRAARHTAGRGRGRGSGMAGESTVRRGHTAIRGGSRSPAAGVHRGLLRGKGLRCAVRPPPPFSSPSLQNSTVSVLCRRRSPVAGRCMGPDPAAASLDPAASFPNLVGALLSRLASRSPEPSSLPSAEPSALKP